MTVASCNGCETNWTALSWAHCPSCHETFSGVTYFDYHRSGGDCWQQRTAYTQHTFRKRLENDELSTWVLVKDDGVWATPEGHTDRALIGARLAKAREARGKNEEDD